MLTSVGPINSLGEHKAAQMLKQAKCRIDTVRGSSKEKLK